MWEASLELIRLWIKIEVVALWSILAILRNCNILILVIRNLSFVIGGILLNQAWDAKLLWSIIHYLRRVKCWLLIEEVIRIMIYWIILLVWCCFYVHLWLFNVLIYDLHSLHSIFYSRKVSLSWTITILLAFLLRWYKYSISIGWIRD
jgi:hypothetical protein